MKIEHVELLVEEPSMEAALRLILPKILGETSFQVYPHQCKEELLKALPQRLRGYASWLPKNWRIVVLIDQDDDNCRKLKAHLEEIAASAGLVTRSRRKTQVYSLANRLVIEELEAWYFGDWAAVQAAFPKVPKTIPKKAKYRNPDEIKGGTWEEFERITQRAGYFAGGLRKIEAARRIAEHMDASRNNSRSFQILRETLLEMTARPLPSSA
jgi:integrase